ncbi:uncharacterized protein LOC125040966 [Penaeus chinensis]|uniref:uncharacterized protein LOC125040966 n=1 Tax=Penaeus chinensis TaxID=139456 RepID=UPI001FB7A432|nr:uncharacterized protein LOC125040966 [Penaeus chinensis]
MTLASAANPPWCEQSTEVLASFSEVKAHDLVFLTLSSHGTLWKTVYWPHCKKPCQLWEDQETWFCTSLTGRREPKIALSDVLEIWQEKQNPPDVLSTVLHLACPA